MCFLLIKMIILLVIKNSSIDYWVNILWIFITWGNSICLPSLIITKWEWEIFRSSGHCLSKRLLIAFNEDLSRFMMRSIRRYSGDETKITLSNSDSRPTSNKIAASYKQYGWFLLSISHSLNWSWTAGWINWLMKSS